MILFAVRRLGVALIVAWLALTLAFVMLRWVPGDAVDATLARAGVPAEELAARRAELGLDQPLWRQYLDTASGLLRADLGESLVSGQPVRELITQNWGPTVTLASAALLVGVTLGLVFGLLGGVGQPRALSVVAQAAASLALSTPVYWTATLAIYVFAVVLGVLPGVGGGGPRYLILPVAVLGFHTAGSIAQVTASSVRAAYGQDFVRTARAKGLPEPDVLEHVLRVGLLPLIAVVALQLGFLLGGTVIVETIFVRRGLGRLLLDAIDARDYPVVQALVALAALTYSMINALADVLFALADPRVARDG